MKDVIDAEFEMVDPNDPSAKPVDSDDAQPTFGKQENDAKRPDKAQLGMFEAAPAPVPTPRREPMGAVKFSIIGFMACAGAFLVSGGYTIIGDWLVPPPAPRVQEAAPYNGPLASSESEGLLLFDVNFEQKANNGREYLSVDGIVRNDGSQAQIIPALRLLFGPEGNQARYRLERGEKLAPGEQLVFTSSIPLRDTAPTNPVLEFIQ